MPVVEFGRVQGVVEVVRGEPGSLLRITVSLETKGSVTRVRSDVLPAVRPIASTEDLAWHADQWTQETIGIDLALAGWEVLGRDDAAMASGSPAICSAVYPVRRLFLPAPDMETDPG